MELLYKVEPNEDEICSTDDFVFIRRPLILDLVEWNGVTLQVPENIKYFIYPKKGTYPLNLNKGFIDYKFVNDDWYKPNLNKIEQFLIKDLRPLNENQKDSCKICTTFSVLYNIMLIPYRLKAYPKSFTIYATKFRNKIYMVRHKKKPDPEERCNLRNTYALKFEQYMFSDSPYKYPDTDVPVDENKKLYGVFTTFLKDFELLYSLRIEGIFAEHELLDLQNMAELYMNRMVLSKLLWELPFPWQTHWKTLNWWVHGYLSGINDIVFGFKDEKGYVREPIQHVNVQSLPMAGNFKPHVCTKFLHKFLTMVDELMRSVNDPYTVYEISYNVEDLSIQYKIHKGKTDLSFLSEEFISFVQDTEL